MLTFREWFFWVGIAVMYVVIGRRIALFPALHTVTLSKAMMRFLFIVDIRRYGIRQSKISIVGIIWQVMTYLTACAVCIIYAFLGLKCTLRIALYIVAVEWFGVGNLLGIYIIISEIVLKRRS